MSYATLVAEATARPDGPSRKQIDWVLKLAGERRDDRIGSDGEERISNVAARIENGATKREVSRWISHLLTLPVDQREVQAPAPREAKEVDSGVTPGVYDVDVHVYVVKPNGAGTRLYAKRLVETRNDRYTESGDMLKIEFVYESGAIFTIKPEHRMDIQRAEALTIRYGHCIVCGRKLRAGQSVKRGIGPVCRKLFA